MSFTNELQAKGWQKFHDREAYYKEDDLTLYIFNTSGLQPGAGASNKYPHLLSGKDRFVLLRSFPGSELKILAECETLEAVTAAAKLYGAT